MYYSHHVVVREWRLFSKAEQNELSQDKGVTDVKQ